MRSHSETVTEDLLGLSRRRHGVHHGLLELAVVVQGADKDVRESEQAVKDISGEGIIYFLCAALLLTVIVDLD